ncbi:MAG TPA: hypothetical protein PKN36_10450 [bacterium]|nr:hypothetical protein [bacterium]
MEKDEIFEVMYMFLDPMDGHIEGDYLGDMNVEELLRAYPELSMRHLEEAKRKGDDTVILNYATGDMVKLTYMGRD